MQSALRATPFGSATRPVAASRRNLTVTCAWGRLANVGGGRKWERTEVNHNGKPVKVPMHVRKGDLVQVIAGNDKGVTGTITKVITTKGLVVIEGVNIRTKHVGPKAENEAGQILKIEVPIHHSNVMHYSKEKQVRSRIGHKMENGKKVRYLIKTGEVIG